MSVKLKIGQLLLRQYFRSKDIVNKISTLKSKFFTFHGKRFHII